MLSNDDGYHDAVLCTQLGADGVCKWYYVYVIPGVLRAIGVIGVTDTAALIECNYLMTFLI